MRLAAVFIPLAALMVANSAAGEPATNRVSLTARKIVVDWTPRIEPGLVCEVEWRSRASATNPLQVVHLGSGKIVEMKPKGQTTNVVVTLELSSSQAEKVGGVSNRPGDFILWGKGYGEEKTK